MTYNMNDFPVSMAGMGHLVRAKTLDLANASEEGALDKDALFTRSRTEAEKWFETASEEEKEELKKRYPEDIERKD